MDAHRPLKYKIATEDWEFDLLHQLNYKTFVEEIPQHQPIPSHRLVDKFHQENTYIIALDDRVLAGMIAFRGKRPFSLDQKLPNLDSYLPPGRRICEIRLLAVEKEYRNGLVFRGLVEFLVQYGLAQGFNLAIISGTTRQEKLYRHMGFRPFGPTVGTVDAPFQPMFLTLESFVEHGKAILPLATVPCTKPISFLPGPVSIHDAVRETLGQFPISHRSDAFLLSFQITKQLLRQLTGGRGVEILLGSGTLANDVVAGQLSLLERPGLVLSNGEFGERLIDQATRFRLPFEEHRLDWGEPFDLELIRGQIKRLRGIDWIWAVHCETSTGVLNDLAGLKRLCAEAKIKLCLDCISSIGTTPVDLKGVFLASGVSGKGLGSFPGLSMVFYDHKVAPAPKRLPRYLDLGYYADCEGVPFTHSSNLLFALQTALSRLEPRRYEALVEVSIWLRAQLRDLGLSILAPDANASPAVVTLILPSGVNSRTLGKKLQKAGYLLSYGSEYLLTRNWIQICLMGEYSKESLGGLLEELKNLRLARRGRSLAATRANKSPVSLAEV